MWGSAAHCPLDPDLLVRAATVARTRNIDSAIHLLQAAMVAGAPASVALDLAQALVVVGRVSEAEAALADFDRQDLTQTDAVSRLRDPGHRTDLDPAAAGSRPHPA